MRIFISYSSKYREICERLQLALEADGRHEVFVDRSELTPGQPFDETLRKGIEDCDLLLFLLSPESVAPGSYALAELSIAKQHWRHPGGRVLPVKVAPVAKEAIPAYLRAVTILEPQGDVVAETVAAVDAFRLPSRRWRGRALLGAALLVVTALGAIGYTQWQRQHAEELRGAEQQRLEQAQAAQRQRAEEAQLATSLTAARQLCESGDHALAWQRYDEADKRFPERPALRQAREDCGMRWLREIHVESGKQTFTDIVNRVLPVLSQGAAAATGQRAGDLRAHMGWADFLRIREGAIRLDPVAHYRQALAADPANVYAHAMWGHHAMVKHEPIAEAKQHFAAALASGRETAWVRSLQFAAFLYYHDAAGQIEAAHAANDMRRRGEALPDDTRERLWTYVYYDGLLSRDRRAGFVAGLRESGAAADPLATFVWLFPEQQVRDDRRALWRFLLASLEEVAGDKSAARQRFESLRDELKRERGSGRILDETLAGIKRLQTP